MIVFSKLRMSFFPVFLFVLHLPTRATKPYGPTQKLITSYYVLPLRLLIPIAG